MSNEELNAEVELLISRQDAENGCTRTLEINDQRVDVMIPAGITSGKKLRLEGKGNTKQNLFGGEARGDLYLKIVIGEELEEFRKKEEEFKETERVAAAARYKHEYKVIKINRDGRGDQSVVEEAESVINDLAKQGWRLHTYSQAAIDGGGAAAGFMKSFGGPGLYLRNVLHLVFEREK